MKFNLWEELTLICHTGALNVPCAQLLAMDLEFLVSWSFCVA